MSFLWENTTPTTKDTCQKNRTKQNPDLNLIKPLDLNTGNTENRAICQTTSQLCNHQNPDSGQSTGDMTTSSMISRKGREKDERGTYGLKEI